MKAVKGNKEYTIEQSQQKFYQDSGYDIKNDSGEIVAYGKGKTVPYGDHAKAVEEIGRLQDELARLESGQDSDGAIQDPKNVCKGTRDRLRPIQHPCRRCEENPGGPGRGG